MSLNSTEFIVSHVLGASIVLGLHNVYVNTTQFQRVRSKRSTTGLLVTAQLVASLSQLINQLFFIVQLTQPIGSMQGCSTLSEVADVFYFLFQLLSSSVLIVRATVLVPPQSKVPVQAGLGLTLVAGYLLTMISSIRKQIIVVNGGFCGALYDFNYNNMGKIIFFVLYVMMLCAFSIPAVRQLQEATRPAPAIKSPSLGAVDAGTANPSSPADRHTSTSLAAAFVLSKQTRSLSQRLSGAGSRQGQTPSQVGNKVLQSSPGANGSSSASVSLHSARRLSPQGKPAAPQQSHMRHMSAIHRHIRVLILTMAFRIFTAIFGYLMTVTLSFLGVWPGSLWMVQFTVQNYCAIVASTFAMGSSASGASGAGNIAGENKRNHRQVANTANASHGRAGSDAHDELAAPQQQSRNNIQVVGVMELAEESEDEREWPSARDAPSSGRIGDVLSSQGGTRQTRQTAGINESLISITSTAMSVMLEGTFAGISLTALSDSSRTSQNDKSGGYAGRQKGKVHVEIDLDALAVWNREQMRSKSRSINEGLS